MAASETIHLLELKMIAKRFCSSSAGALLEKVIRENYGMLRHETSMRKPFISKTIYAVHLKKISPYTLFLENFRKVFRRKNHKNFEKD